MLEHINDIAHHHPEYAMAIAFMFAFIESLPFIGSFFPGMLTMPPIGWLMATGVIPGWQTFSLILVGAMLGDYVGFYLGYVFRGIAHQKASEYRKTHWLDAGEAFIQRYGPMSIIIGRFIGPFRSSIPLFAGIFKMNSFYFSMAALPSVALWAIVHLCPGALIAWFDFDILQHTGAVVNSLMLAFCALLCLALAFSNRLSRTSWIQPALDRICQLVSQPVHLRQIILRIGLLFLCLCILSTCIINGGLDGINHMVYALISSQYRLIVKLSLIQNAFCYIPFVLLLTVFLSMLFAHQHRYHDALRLFLSVSIAFATCFLLKYLIHYPRPAHVAALLGNQSLPSGHSCLTTAFILAYYHSKKERHRYEYGIGLAFIVMTMVSRVLIGAHWAGDVLMGWIIGYLAYQLGVIIAPSVPLHLLSKRIPSSVLSITNGVMSRITHLEIMIAYAGFSIVFAIVTNKLSVLPYLI